MIARRSLIVLLPIVLLAAAVLFSRPAWQVPYHSWRMRASWNKHISQPAERHGQFSSIDVGRAHERYEHHRQRLVDLGAMLQREYRFRHIDVPSPEARHFTRFLHSPDRPECLDFTFPYPTDPEPMHLTVWCSPENGAAWDSVVAARDTAEYRRLFMSDEPDE